jgi:hypothetical protein
MRKGERCRFETKPREADDDWRVVHPQFMGHRSG